jgi:hypothetical protein
MLVSVTPAQGVTDSEVDEDQSDDDRPDEIDAPEAPNSAARVVMPETKTVK